MSASGSRVRRRDPVGERRPGPAWPALRGAALARVVYQHLAHRVRGNGEQVRTVLGAWRASGQLEVRLVNERRRVDRARPVLAGELASGEPAEVIVQERQDAVERRTLTGTGGCRSRVTSPGAVASTCESASAPCLGSAIQASELDRTTCTRHGFVARPAAMANLRD